MGTRGKIKINLQNW